MLQLEKDTAIEAQLKTSYCHHCAALMQLLLHATLLLLLVLAQTGAPLWGPCCQPRPCALVMATTSAAASKPSDSKLQLVISA
jgi:hypothetical protein